MKSIKKQYSNRIEYQNEQGFLHREDGPAVIWNNGNEEWFNNGKPHRENGPAVVHIDGFKEWWFNGVCHREDGPAVEWNDGTKQWLLYGTFYLEEDWKQEVANIKLKRILDL
jgi:hypothetical protein